MGTARVGFGAEGEASVVVDDVAKWYGQVEAVGGISFEAGRGEFVSILGPSGCGKTTTLRMIAGLEVPSAGRIFLEGRDVTRVPPFQRNTPMVWQSFALIPHLNVVANVEFGLKMRGLRRQERRREALAMLEAVGMRELAGRPVDALSSGQKQRVGLARALVLRPPLLLLDEPLAALDASLRVQMQSELRRIQRECRITFLFVTHSQSEALSMSDRVIVMNRGQIEQIGAPETIYRRPATRFVAEFIGSNNMVEGDVETVEGGVAQIRSPVGRVAARAADPDAAKASGRVLVIVPAECVELEEGDKALGARDPERQSEIRAVYSGLEFHGSLITLFFRLKDGRAFRVEKHGTRLAAWRLAAGEEYVLTWRARDAYCLAVG